ncbi:MAG: TIR domain-containing protein [Alphaproteobacteria bacterium]|nr:MAG: TIR domain-containing protein [Alphaproteobacteria bacterium]
MADIFVSYSSHDHAEVKPLVEILEQKGYSVWWDNDLRGGSRFSEEIERELEQAKAVIVVWTKESRKSRWVTDEADCALAAAKLIPIKFDVLDAPIGFRQIQTIDFTTWQLGEDSHALTTLDQAIHFHVSQNKAAGRTGSPTGSATPEASIAVLPFVNMSSDPEQAFFSDGISEELLNLLAKIGNLKVTARTSSFQFKDKNLSISTMGEILGVAHVLEGSVRKAGNRVRITAQLIKVADDSHLWSETYDRVLEDVFAIQDEIAAAIVDALKERIAVNPVAPAVTRAHSITAYEEYLLGQQSLKTRTVASIKEAHRHFEISLQADSEFVPSLVGMADAILLSSNHPICYGTRPVEETLIEARPYLEKSARLNPNSDECLLSWALYFYMGHNMAEAQTHVEKAISINANCARGYRLLGLILKRGANPRALVVRSLQKALSLDPVSGVDLLNLLEELPQRMRYDEAQQLLERIEVVEPNSMFSQWGAFHIAWNRGELRKCLSICLSRLNVFNKTQWSTCLQTVMTALGDGPTVEHLDAGSAFNIYTLFGMTEDANRMAAVLQNEVPDATPTILAYWHFLNDRIEAAHEILTELEPRETSGWGPLFEINEFCLGAITLWAIKARKGDAPAADADKRRLKEVYSVYLTDHEGVHRGTHFIGACICMMDGEHAVAIREARQFARQAPGMAKVLINTPLLKPLWQEEEFQELQDRDRTHSEREKEKAQLSGLLPLSPENLEQIDRNFSSETT